MQARTEGQEIPEGWAVGDDGAPTTDPANVAALLPAAGPKGYGLAMMVDVLSGVLLGLPFGKRVSSMYEDLQEGRDLGQLHIVLNPAVFTNLSAFKTDISTTMRDLTQMVPAPGFDRVLYPGQDRELVHQEYQRNGIDITDEVYDYLVSDVVHRDRYKGQSAPGNDSDTVPAKQLYRWKDDGGALPPPD